jgi:hypothetical protein
MFESGVFTFGSLNDEPVFWFELCEPRLELPLDPLIPELPELPRLPELLDPLCDERDELFRLSLFLFRSFGIHPPALSGRTDINYAMRSNASADY